jgi:hypothetical protein
MFRKMSLFAALVLASACTGKVVGDGDGVVDEDERPQPGWEAPLNGSFHDVAGTAVLVDEETLEIRDFVYDGGGINARVFLVVDGAPFTRDIELTDNLVGTPFDGETLTLDLPPEAFEFDWNALTLWCIPAAVSFGEGTFNPPEEDTFE